LFELSTAVLANENDVEGEASSVRVWAGGGWEMGISSRTKLKSGFLIVVPTIVQLPPIPFSISPWLYCGHCILLPTVAPLNRALSVGTSPSLLRNEMLLLKSLFSTLSSSTPVAS